MTVLILERVPASLRGELSRWMIEPRTGVFIGRVSAMVRDRLWLKAMAGARGGSGMLLHSASNEQGFTAVSFGDTSRHLLDWEGLTLVHVPHAVAVKKMPRRKSEEAAGETAKDAAGETASEGEYPAVPETN